MDNTDAVDMGMFEGYPGPEIAYAEAPPVEYEHQALAELVATMDAPGRPAYFPPAAPSERREVLLRQAALADRLALAAPDDVLAGRTAAHAGFLLLKFDLLHPNEWDGPEGPDSALWDGEGGTRAYTRSHYARWLLVPRWSDGSPAWAEPGN